jgi:hypothetical protein
MNRWGGATPISKMTFRIRTLTVLMDIYTNDEVIRLETLIYVDIFNLRRPHVEYRLSWKLVSKRDRMFGNHRCL